MHDKLVKSGDAEKLSAGVAKDAINRYNAKRKSDNMSLSYLYLIVQNFNNVQKRISFFGSKLELQYEDKETHHGEGPVKVR